MYTRIIVPLDGSQRAEQALPVAARIARHTGGALVLARVVRVASELNRYFVLPPSGSPGLSLDEFNAADEYLHMIAHSDVLAGIDPLTVVLAGSTANALLDEIDVEQADLVVMTSRGHTTFGRWSVGSVAQHIVRHATVPVLVLREHIPFVGEMGATDRPLRVLVPLDGSPRAETVVPRLLDLLEDLRISGGAHISLVYVVNPIELAIAQIEQTIALEGANRYLECVADEIEAAHPGAGVTVSKTLMLRDDVADALIELAQPHAESPQTDISEGYDLVVMATHGRSGVARWALGSVTERTFGAASVPFLVVRPPEIARQQHTDETPASNRRAIPLLL